MRVQQTYRFMDDATSVETSRYSTQTPMSLMGKEDKEHTIESFAMRPMEIANFDLKTTSVSGDTIFYYNFLSLLSNQNVKGKFDGFRYFRADICVEVYYNAQPFQQGALLGYYLPYRGKSDHWTQTQQVTSKTGCLSESVIFEDQEPLVLNIPFNHPHGFIDLVDPVLCDLGMFYLDVYSPLESNLSSDSVSITVFAHFTNITLYGPTDEVRHDSSSVALEAQMGEAQEQEQSGVVTQVSGIVKEVSTALEDVPVVGVVAKPISWIASAVNSVASLFGWSKPVSTHTTGLFKQAPARYMANYNGIDTSNNMGLDADNQLQSYAFFGKEDPLDFNNIVTRPNYISNFVWKTSYDNYGKLLSLDVSPTVGWSLETVENQNTTKYQAIVTKNFTQMNFVAQHFKYWRGNIVFQFKCVKTKFHSGRLLVTWRPGTTVSYSNPRVPMTYSIVWELAKKKTLAFQIPYLNPKPWLFVENPSESYKPTGLPFKNGVIEIFVLNKLVASSEAVSQQVHILVEVCGGKDLAFSVPVTPTLFPLGGTTVTRIDPPPSDDEDISLEPQIGIESELVSFVPDGTVGVGIEPEKMSIGEKVVSFRQLIKRFTYFQLAGNSPTIFPSIQLNPELKDLRNSNRYMVRDDYGYGPYRIADIKYDNLDYCFPQATGQGEGGKPAIEWPLPFTTDLLTGVCSLFAYTRGSIRLKCFTDIVKTARDKGSSMITCQLVDGAGKDLSSMEVKRGAPVMLHRAATSLIARDNEGVVEVQFPYYSDMVYMPKGWAGFGKLQTEFARFIVNEDVETLMHFNFYRAAGDDFDCAFLVGTPQMQWVDIGAIHS